MGAKQQLRAVVIAGIFGTAASVAADPGSLELEEVVVSARKQAELMQDVPLAVAATTARQMAVAGIREISDLPALMPTLIVTTNSSPLNTSYRIRRIGNEGNIPDFEADSGLFVDGAYRSRSGLGLGDLADIERIEVVRGPQSTLYGKNVTAGVISVTTAEPSQAFGAMGELTAGTDGLAGLRGYVTGGMTDTLSGRLSVSGTQRDPIQQNLNAGDANTLNQYSLRGQLLYQPTDALRLRLIAAHSDRHMKPNMADMFYGPRLLAAVDAVVANPGALAAVDVYRLTDGVINGNARRLVDNDPVNNRIQYAQASDYTQAADDGIAAIEYQADDYTLTSITSYDRYDVVMRSADIGQSGVEFLSFRDAQAGETFSQELRIDSRFGNAVTWLAGLYYYDNKFTRGDNDRPEFRLGVAVDELGVALSLQQPPPLPQQTGPMFGLPGDTGDFHEKADNSQYGVFSQGSWRATDALMLTLGLRHTREQKAVALTNMPRTSMPGPLANLPTLLVTTLTPATASFAADDTWSAVTGTFSTEYHISADNMVYAAVANGFKSGGFVGNFGNTAPARRPFDKETVVNYEIGAKCEIGRRVRLNVAAFWTDYTDFQSAAFVGLKFLVNNAEKVNVKGVEVEATAKLADHLILDMSATYAHASYDEYTQGSCHAGRAPSDPATGTCDLGGRTLPFAPRLTASTGLQWEHSIGPGSLYSRLDASYVGSQNVTSELDPYHGERDAYALVNFRLGWRQDVWDVSAWVKNLEDTTYLSQAGPTNLFAGLRDGSYQNFLGAPRSVGVTLRSIY